MSEIHITPSWDLGNLLEQLIDLRKTVYLLDYQFIIRGYNLGTARWKRDIGQDTEKGSEELPCPL